MRLTGCKNLRNKERVTHCRSIPRLEVAWCEGSKAGGGRATSLLFFDQIKFRFGLNAQAVLRKFHFIAVSKYERPQ